MKITYIHHSSFSVELDNTILLFDYFKGNLPSFDKNKKLYVFSSHSHHDHFDESIFLIAFWLTITTDLCSGVAYRTYHSSGCFTDNFNAPPE